MEQKHRMKPMLYSIPKSRNEAVFVEEYDSKNRLLHPALHYHPELQISLFGKVSGHAMVGDAVGPFEKGDVFMLGSNLPHVFRNDPEKNGDGFLAIMLFINASVFEPFFKQDGMHAVQRLITQSASGLMITGGMKKEMHKSLLKLPGLDYPDRLVMTMRILVTLAKSAQYKQLSGAAYAIPPSDSESKRMNDLYGYVLAHYKEPISLEDMSQVANMTPTALCRFFKQRTRKTLKQFVNEVRIGQACRMLIETDCSISQAAWGCGYNNLSNFNRQFRRIKGVTPQKYQSACMLHY